MENDDFYIKFSWMEGLDQFCLQKYSGGTGNVNMS